ncbi:MAG: MBL fold metallo-hydrolase [Thermoprotei archaeon]
MPKIVFLGTGAGGFRGSARCKSSVYMDGMLFDCGAGVTGRLEDLGLLDKLDAVFITHLHSDHMSGIYDTLVSMVVERRSRPLSIYAPAGLSDLLESYSSLGNKLSSPETGFSVNLYTSPDTSVRIREYTVEGILLDHVVTNVGYLIRWADRALVYTGDTREPSNLLRYRVDYLIHEATFTERFKGLAEKYGHTTALEAAKTAQAVGAKKFFITHIENRADPTEEKLREARDVYPDAIMPNDLEEFTL